ncbi:MAG: hypothetical protein ACOYN4_17415 [Bacteroidales bacterium]
MIVIANIIGASIVAVSSAVTDLFLADENNQFLTDENDSYLID